MTVKVVSNEKIAETSSKGNQEKWYDRESDSWYKSDQFGYEGLAETVISELLEESNIETQTPFTFVRYAMTRLHVHGRERTGCVSKNFLNDDRHLNNIAVIEKDGKYSYCPIFDNGAGLLSDVRFSPLDIDPKGLIREAVARPMGTGFTRQMNTARALFGSVLKIRKFDRAEISEKTKPLLEYYSKRDGELILERVEECILTRQKFT